MATLARSSGGSLVIIFVIVAQCFLHAVCTPIPSDEQSSQNDTLLSSTNSSRQSRSNGEDSELPIDVRSGIPRANFDRPSADVVFGRKKKPHVLKSSPPVNHHQPPITEPAVSPVSFADVPSSPKPPCVHHVNIEPVQIPFPISPLPFFSTVHPPYPRIEPAEIPASVRPVQPSFFETSRPPLPPKKHETTEAPVSVPSSTPSTFDLPSSSSESLPNDVNIGDIFGSTAVTEPHQPTSESAVTPVQETAQTEEKPHADHKPVEPKPHRSVIASILHKKEQLKEKIHHKDKEEGSTAAKPHNSILSSILHKKEQLKEKIHHEKKEENAAAAKPHHSIVSSILHKKEHLKEKIHHKESEGKEGEKVPAIAEKPVNEGQHSEGGSHHEFSLLHKKIHLPSVSSLLHKIHHKREVSQHETFPHGSAISSISHKVEHLKEKILHKGTKGSPGAAKPHHSIVSSIAHKKEHLKEMIHHEQKKEHSIIASIFHKEDEAKEVKIPAKESPASEVHNHELPAPHESLVSSLRHKIHHKRESSSVHKKEEESLNFDVPHIGLPVPKSSILHKLKSLKDHEEHEHKPHSLLKDLLHKV